MSEEYSVVEILELAIKSEEDAAEFYGSMSKLVKNSLVRTKFESLAKEEVGHRHMLEELYRKKTGEKSSAYKIPQNVPTAEKSKIKFAVESIEELLKFAIEREQNANAFYKKAASKVSESTSKRLFEYLSDIERGHEMMLKQELEAYLRDKNWYSDNPDIQLVGP